MSGPADGQLKRANHGNSFDSPEISGQIVAFDSDTLRRWPVAKADLIREFREINNPRAVRIVQTLPARANGDLVGDNVGFEKPLSFFEEQRARRMLLEAAVRDSGSVTSYGKAWSVLCRL